MEEIARLQSEYRLLQNQAHAVLGVGFALGAVSLAVGKSLSLHLAIVILILAWGFAISWYMNINAESTAVGTARDHLSRALTEDLRGHGEARVTYSDIVARAGVNALGTAAENFVAATMFFGVVTVGGIVAFHAPVGSVDALAWPRWIRIATWAAASVVSVSAIVLAMIENRHYRRRVLAAIAADDPAGAESAGGRRLSDLSAYIVDRDRGLEL